MMNQVVLSGKINYISPIKTSKTGNDCIFFLLAIKRENQNTHRVENNYIKCITFGNRAVALSNYTDKGSEILVSGKLEILDLCNNYIVNVNDIQFLSYKNPSENSIQITEDMYEDIINNLTENNFL